MEQVLALPAKWWGEAVTVWLIVAVVVYLIVAIPGIYFLVKYKYKPGEREIGDHDFEGHWGLEVAWTVIPLLVVIFLATYSFAIFKKQRTVPDGAMTIKVTAFMWGWQFDYLDDEGKVIKTVVTGYNPNDYTLPEEQKPVVPAGKPVRVLLTSMDVIHSFYVMPARITEDAVPGRTTYLWFQINKPGEYYIFCREFCGTGHSHMFSILKVVPPEQFTAWLKGENKAVALNLEN
ncbi:MAG: cytochrome c oxidase subunit II [Aquificae bacterium]|nr:cytochrome c oxidase subunit II [Aquificota bacterium]